MVPALGKRKERNDDPASSSHGSTLFVSNLPYTATSIDLQTLFSDIAPVRSAFIVTEHGTGVSKGVGYVAFAIKEDAQAALEKIEKEGINLAGRKLRVQWAENKRRDNKDEDPDSTTKKSKPRPEPKQPHPKLPSDPLAIRTIVISGLPSSVDSKALWKKVRKYDGAEKVEWPIKTGTGEEEDNTTAHALFATPSAASDAVTKLHAHVFKGSLLSVTLKKRLETLSKPTVSSGKQKQKQSEAEGTSGSAQTAMPTAAAAPNRSSRLIVRNLPFNATEQDLRAVFLPYGPIHSVHIPTEKDPSAGDDENGDGKAAAASSSPKTKKNPRTKGFAFVWMLSRKDAERAIEGCNGKMVRAGTAEALVSNKQKKKKQRRLEEKLAAAKGKKEGEDGDGEAEEEAEAGEEEEEKGATERVIAVDWALSKERWKEEKAKMELELEKERGEDDDGDVEMEGASGSGSDSDEDEDEENLGVHDGGSGVSDGESRSDDDDDERDEETEDPVKPTLPPPAAGTTLFVRNVPFEATEDELRTLFRVFGPLRYARITIDHDTGRSRGTGFVCFWNLEDADKVVQQSELLKVETTGTGAQSVKKNPFTMPSILTPDPSSTLAQSLVLHGRTLDVVRAVTRDEAGRLKDAGEKARQKADKRNMYLLREGVILPNSPAAHTLASADLERRTASFNARRTLIKSNPSLYISKTRLSVRQIPVFVTERMVKRLAGHAVREFEREVKAAGREGLNADELTADVLGVVGEEGEAAEDEAQKKKKKWKEQKKLSGVKQAKIVRQTERVDPLTGKGRSRGYGFLEMSTHADALRVLRWANNNPKAGELFEGWWKDEVKEMVKVQAEKVKKGNDKDEREKDEARLTRLRKELEELESVDGAEGEGKSKRKSKGTLIVEFSIENVQVVQRRSALQSKEKTGPEDKKTRPKPMLDGDRPQKKRRLSNANEAEKEAEPMEEEHKQEAKKSPTKNSNPLGAIIGRKRKERKTGKRKGGN